MSEFLEYSFRIIGPKPDTMPMSRLALYMADLARLMGATKDVHFQRIEDRSVSIIASAPQSEIPIISPRLRAASRGGAAADVAAPWRRINGYLAEDGWNAEMKLPRSADVIVFPGKVKAATILRSISQHTSVQGRLVRLEGTGDVVRVGLELDGNLKAGISISSHHAKDLAGFFLRYVRLSGDGIWKRDSDGKWSLDKLNASAFELLDEADLKSVLGQISDLIPSGTGKDIYAAVDELRSA
ncbi:hypothetical protein H4S14_000890 [Agrobacterium vitis]|nr:hypothetical protein [Agrobacterium vitis]MBE1437163.1 hypothetical protein [Agrobacterium vitis]